MLHYRNHPARSFLGHFRFLLLAKLSGDHRSELGRQGEALLRAQGSEGLTLAQGEPQLNQCLIGRVCLYSERFAHLAALLSDLRGKRESPVEVLFRAFVDGECLQRRKLLFLLVCGHGAILTTSTAVASVRHSVP